MAGRDAPLNPDSIEAPGFRTAALGYRKEEVDAFLRQLADAVRSLGLGVEAVPPASDGEPAQLASTATGPDRRGAQMTSAMEADTVSTRQLGDHQALFQAASGVLDRLLQQVGDECEEMLRSSRAESDRILAAARSSAEDVAVEIRRAAETDAATTRQTAEADASKIRDAAITDREQSLEEARAESEVIVREARILAERERASVLAIVESVRQQLGHLDEIKASIEGAAERLSREMPSMPDSRTAVPAANSREAVNEIDTSVLRSLESELGAEAFADVIDTFLRDVDTQVERLESALAANDTETAARVLHTLGSSCATVGAHGVAELCRSLTVDAPRERFEELPARCRIVRQQVAAVRNA